MHRAALLGYGCGADEYQRGRPDYPQALLGWLRQTLRVESGRNVIDLGAGTGKFTKLLLETGATVVAIEPVAAMREVLQASLPTVTCAAGTAQSIPSGDASADVVICAQSFHWFASTEALAEIHRVLRPGGILGLVWNVRDESVAWVAAVTKLLIPYEGNTPRFHTGDWRRPFDGRFFTDLDETRFDHCQAGASRQAVLDRFMSVSFIAALQADQKTEVMNQLQSLINAHPALRGRDAIDLPYVTRAFYCVRKSDRPAATRHLARGLLSPPS